MIAGRRLGEHWRRVLVIAILAGSAPYADSLSALELLCNCQVQHSTSFKAVHAPLTRLEKNLTNSSLSHIGGALKTVHWQQVFVLLLWDVRHAPLIPKLVRPCLGAQCQVLRRCMA